MKIITVFLLVLCWANNAFAWTTTTTLQAGSLDNKITIVFIPSGFADTSDEGVGDETFITEVTNNLHNLWSNNFFSAYRHRFDVIRVDDQYDADGLLKTDAEINNLIDSNDTCAFSDSGTCKKIHVIIEDAAGSDLTEKGFVRLRNAADDDYTLAHEILTHILGKHSFFSNAGPILKDEYDCTGFTYSYGYSNIHDKAYDASGSNEIWDELESGAASDCDGYSIPTFDSIHKSSSYPKTHNVGYKAGQIGLAKRTQDSNAYSPLGTDFVGTVQYGQDTTEPTTTVEGIVAGADGNNLQMYYGVNRIRVYPTDTSGIDRVEFYLDSDDTDDYVSVCIDSSAPYICDLDLNDHGNGPFSLRIHTYDEAWNYKQDQFDDIDYTHYERIGEGCTTAFFIDRDCDGYGVGRQFVIGADADDKNALYNTLASVEADYGDLDGCTGSDTTCADNLKKWLAARTDRAYTGKKNVYYVDAATGGAGRINRVQSPFTSIKTWGDSTSALANGGGANDIVVVRDGNQGVSSYIGGSNIFSEGNELLIISMPGETPIITGTEGNCFKWVNGHGYWTVDSLVLDSCSGDGFGSEGTGTSTNMLFRNNEITDVVQFFRFHLQNTNHIYENNVLYNGRNGIHMMYDSCYYGDCTGNIFRGNVAYHDRPAGESQILHWGCSDPGRWVGLIFEDNIVHGGVTAVNFDGNYDGLIIRNNVFF